MPIGDFLRSIFRADKTASDQVSGDVAWSESLIYGSSTFPKYNPDDLIGRKGAGIYRKMMQDEQIKAVVRFKRDAITSRQWYFECGHEGLSEEESDARVKFFEKAVRSMSGSFVDALNGIMSSMYNGFSMTEKVFKPEDIGGVPMLVIAKLKLRPFDTFYFHVDSHGNIERVVQKYDGKEQDIDLAKFIHFVQSPDYDEHYGSSELREAYRPWFSKDITIRMWNIFLERMAAGFVWVTPKDGKSLTAGSAEYNNLVKVLSNITTKTAIILPSGVELNVQTPQSTDAYQQAVAAHDKAIAKALLVPNLLGISEQGSTGSYSQSKTQLEAFFWTLEADSARLCETLNEQLFKELGDLNYGDGMYPTFKFKPISDDKKFEIVRLWKELVGAKAVSASDSDEDHLRELLGMPERSEDEIDADPGGEETPPANGEQMPEGKQDDEEYADETVVGRGKVTTSRKHSCGHDHGPKLATKAAFSAAMKRVDFAVIGSKSDDAAEQSAYLVASVNGDAVARMVEEASTIGFDVDKVPDIKFQSAELAAMKKEVMAGLAEGWKIGSQHAQKELRKASKEKFGRAYFETTDRALTDIAADYFKSRAHTITGNISGATQSTIQNVLLEGIKNSKTFDETKREIYKALEAEGLLTDEDIIEALGTVTVKNTKARIQTIMRTSEFEAINEARYQYFSDPGLDGFVEALEYSAILDDRTTEICSELDGKTFAANSEEWQTFNPPNHFNALASGTVIKTEKGPKRIEDIRIGDRVLTHRGRFRAVYELMAKEADGAKIRLLHTDSGSVLAITDEHPVLTTTGWKRSDDLQVGDVVVQHAEDVSGLENSIVADAQHAPSIFDQESVTYQVGISASRVGVILSVNLKDESFTNEGEICDIAANRMLGYKRNAAVAQKLGHDAFVKCGLLGEGGASGDGSGLGDACHIHRIAFGHAFGVGGMDGASLLPESEGPMGFTLRTIGVRHGVRDTCLVGALSDGNSVAFAPTRQGGFAEAHASLDSANGLLASPVTISNQVLDSCFVGQVHNDRSGYVGSAIKSIAEVDYTSPVWNIAVEEDESYVADGFVVHNCRSLLIPVTVNDSWTPSEPPNVMPQKGFGFAKRISLTLPDGRKITGEVE